MLVIGIVQHMYLQRINLKIIRLMLTIPGKKLSVFIKEGEAISASIKINEEENFGDNDDGKDVEVISDDEQDVLLSRQRQKKKSGSRGRNQRKKFVYKVNSQKHFIVLTTFQWLCILGF